MSPVILSVVVVRVHLGEAGVSRADGPPPPCLFPNPLSKHIFIHCCSSSTFISLHYLNQLGCGFITKKDGYKKEGKKQRIEHFCSETQK